MNVALCPDHVDILSICTGGAGLDLGIELAMPSARTVCMVEREAFSVAHLVAAMQQGLLAECPVWSDARTFDGRAWRGAVDGLIGGIPCQPHSMAGRKRGSLDARDLWSTARRIVVQSRCWFVLIENVGGMLSAGDDEIAGAERVWRDLRKLGFAVEIGLFTAAEVGASHERERVFILGVADAERNGWRQGPDVLQPRADKPEPAICGQILANACSHRCERGPQPHFRPNEPGQQTPRRGDAKRRDHDVVDTIRGRHDGRADDQVRRQGERAAPEGPVGTPYLFPPGPDHLSRWSSVLTSSPELEPAFRRVADGLASRLDIGRVDRLRMLGNGVVPLQAAYAVRTLATRLAGRGSAGAARLVRMMVEA